MNKKNPTDHTRSLSTPRLSIIIFLKNPNDRVSLYANRAEENTGFFNRFLVNSEKRTLLEHMA